MSSEVTMADAVQAYRDLKSRRSHEDEIKNAEAEKLLDEEASKMTTNLLSLVRIFSPANLKAAFESGKDYLSASLEPFNETVENDDYLITVELDGLKFKRKIFNPFGTYLDLLKLDGFLFDSFVASGSRPDGSTYRRGFVYREEEENRS